MRNVSREEQYRSVLGDVKAARTIGVVIGTFFCCWLPFILISVVFAFIPVNLEFANFTKWLTYINALLNPLVYSLLDRELRGLIFKRFRSGICRSWLPFMHKRGPKTSQAPSIGTWTLSLPTGPGDIFPRHDLSPRIRGRLALLRVTKTTFPPGDSLQKLFITVWRNWLFIRQFLCRRKITILSILHRQKFRTMRCVLHVSWRQQPSARRVKTLQSNVWDQIINRVFLFKVVCLVHVSHYMWDESSEEGLHCACRTTASRGVGAKR